MKTNHKPISLFEYDSKIFDEPLKPVLAVLLNKRCQEINKHTKRVVLEPIHNNSNQTVGVKSYQYVGVISVHRTLVIQILPKMYNPKTEETKWQQSIQNLLYMLNYCGKLLNTHISSSQLKNLRGDFYEILIYLYASTLLSEIRNSLHHEYTSQEHNLAYLKGKLLFNKQIQTNSINQHKFYLETDEFDPNNNLNKVFAYVTRQLFLNTNNVKNRQLLSELNLLLSDVEYRKVTHADASKIHISRLNQRFKPALELAKLFLSGNTLQLSSSSFETSTFLIDMNVLFEDFIAKLVKKQSSGNSIVYTQGPRKHLVTGQTENGEYKTTNIFQMRPDITIADKFTNEVSHIIDTKYKILNGEQRKLGISQSDMYQMYAYSHKYNVRDITLIYPEQTDESIQQTSYEIKDSNLLERSMNIHIRTIDLNRDVRSNIESIKNDITKILCETEVVENAVR